VERTTIAGETEELGENLPQRHFVPPQIPHDQVWFRTPDRSGGKPATNRLSYGAASNSKLVRPLNAAVLYLTDTGIVRKLCPTYVYEYFFIQVSF
jgi:hypothetical protein